MAERLGQRLPRTSHHPIPAARSLEGRGDALADRAGGAEQGDFRASSSMCALPMPSSRTSDRGPGRATTTLSDTELCRRERVEPPTRRSARGTDSRRRGEGLRRVPAATGDRRMRCHRLPSSGSGPGWTGAGPAVPDLAPGDHAGAGQLASVNGPNGSPWTDSSAFVRPSARAILFAEPVPTAGTWSSCRGRSVRHQPYRGPHRRRFARDRGPRP